MNSFIQAKPIWGKGKQGIKNCSLGFLTKLSKGKYKIALTGSDKYRIFLNGKFIGYGPAQCARGYFRIDEYNLNCDKKINYVYIEVVAYLVNGFSCLNQEGFLVAEVYKDNEIIKFTGDNNDFQIYTTPRLTKVLRFSRQRGFSEYYIYNKNLAKYNKGCKKVKTSILDNRNYKDRIVNYPTYNKIDAKLIDTGYVDHNSNLNYNDDIKWFSYIKDDFFGIYNFDELERNNFHLYYEWRFFKDATINKEIKEGKFFTFAFKEIEVGFIKFKIDVKKKTTLHIIMGECYNDDDWKNVSKIKGYVNPIRNCLQNVISYELEPGRYELINSEPYSFKYLRFVIEVGEALVRKVSVVEYKNSSVGFKIDISDKKLNLIAKAAIRSFEHNSVDIFTDCPHRERAGWLCDSYYSGLVEQLLCKDNKSEKIFLENYALYENHGEYPTGMVPMCYPSESEKGKFIPNWGMYYILELKSYYDRTHDDEILEQSKDKIDGLLKYFSQFVNQYGLLENLSGWLFIDWSDANKYTDGVNFPTNVLYSKVLKDTAALLKDSKLKEQGDKFERCFPFAFDGEFFKDHAVFDSVAGKFKILNDISEACQYYPYAYFLDSPKGKYLKLYKKLLKDFTHNRNDTIIYPNVKKGNVFLSYDIKLEMLVKYHDYKNIVKVIKDCYFDMAKETHTLWELNTTQTGSLDHGFSSYVMVALIGALAGYYNGEFCDDYLGIDAKFYIPRIDKTIIIKDKKRTILDGDQM